MTPTQVIAVAITIPVAIVAVILSAALRVVMIGKLNAHNPPERQYDRWGWLIVNKRFNLFTRKYYWYEYYRVFGFDRLLLGTVIVMAVSGAIGLFLAVTFASVALTR